MVARQHLPIPTLLLYAKGNVSWQQCVADTLIDGMGLDFTKLPRGLFARLPKRLQHSPYRSLSYVGDWVVAFQGSSRLKVQLCNVCDLTDVAHWMPKIREFPLIFLMHSANGDGIGPLNHLANVLRKRRGLFVVFVANEYNHLEEKREFIRRTETDFVGTQLTPAAAAWLYSDCGRARPLPAFAALNTRSFYPSLSQGERQWDLAFRGNAYAKALGDDERTRAISAVRAEGERRGLRVNIDFSLVPGSNWADLLRASNAIPGAESGTYFLERNSASYHRAEAYEREHPEVSIEEMRALFYSQGHWPVSGKMLSSRHLEPMGTKTCQLLVAGEYNGVLEPDVHYIPLAKDLSNVSEALEKYGDVSYRSRIAESAYDLAMTQHTFERRVDQILNDLGL